MKSKVYTLIYYYLLFLIPFFSFAEIKNTNNTDWPLEMNSSKNFDIASKCEMLVFIEVFNEYVALSKSDLSLKTKVKNIKEQSVNTWVNETKKRILVNFKRLSNASLLEVISVKKGSSWEMLSRINVKEKLPNNFTIWYEATKKFYRDYVKEQIRLAALYPRVTSEILQFSENEIQGDNFTDKNFLLTFDDGPTKVNGNTDKLIKVLDKYELTGMFFVLGESLEKRLKSSSKKALNNLYKQNKVFSHGKVHKSHQRYSLWKTSIDDTNKLIHDIFPTENKSELLYFRPPYGQRNKALVSYFDSQESKIIYWNIDSRDWSSKLNAQQVANRQIKLMLLWRKGILLFHDIHRKSQKSVPLIYNYFKGVNINWKASNMVFK